jgi:hypothetical protein
MSLEAIWKIFSEVNPALLGVFTFLLGLFLGNRLALGRELRTEFNIAAVPVRSWLLNELKQPANPSRWPEAIELDAFTSYLPWWRRRAFTRACNGLSEAQQTAMVQGPEGDISYPDISKIEYYLAGLLPYTSRK